MLRPVKHVNIPADCLGSDDVWVLGHVSSAVDLVLMVDSLNDSDPRRGRRVVIANLCA